MTTTERNGGVTTAYDQSYNDTANEEDFEDQESNSAKLFERSRIKALAGR